MAPPQETLVSLAGPASDRRPVSGSTVVGTVPRAGLTGAAALVTVIRWWISHRRAVFHLTPDEPGQLAIARFVSGTEARWNMLDHSTWRPGYGTLISLVHWFTSDPVTSFRAALGVNAVLGGVSCVLLALLARRVTSMSAGACVASAIVLSLAPAVLFTTNWVWSEALVSVAFLGTVLALLAFHERPSFWRGGRLLTLAGIGFATHSRLLPLMVVSEGLIVLAAARHQLTRWQGVVVTAYGVALSAAVSGYTAFVVAHVWEDPRSTNSAAALLGQLGKGSSVAVSAFGQIWYQLVTTVGIAGLGAIALVRSARVRGSARPSTADARVLLAAVAPLIAVSVVFMSDRWRTDQLVYGRYNDAVLGPVLIFGIGTLVTARSAVILRSAVLVLSAMVASGVLLHALRGDELAHDAGVRPMALGLQSLVGRAPTIKVGSITLAAGILGVIVVGVAMAARTLGRRVWVPATLLVLVVAGDLRTRPIVDSNLNVWAMEDDVAALRDGVLSPGTPVRFRLVPDREEPSAPRGQQKLRTMLYQFYLPENPLHIDGEQPVGVTTPWVFAPLDDQVLSTAGAVVVWRDPDASIGLWLEPVRGGRGR